MALGAGTTIGTFRAVLGLDTSDYARGIINAEAMNRVFGSSFTSFVSNPLLGSIDIIKNAVGGLLRYSGQLLSTAEDVQRLGQVTGVSAESIQALRRQMELAGHDAKAADDGLRFLARGLGDAQRGAGPAVQALEALGISIEDIADTEEGLRIVLDALDAVPDAATRSALAAKLLGEQAGAKLVNAVGGGARALDDLIDRGLRLGKVIEEATVDSLAGLNTTLGLSKQSLEGIRQAATAAFLKGFAGEFDSGAQSAEDLAERINASLTPALERMGRATGEFIGNLDSLIERLERVGNIIHYWSSGGDVRLTDREFAEMQQRIDERVNSGRGPTNLDRVLAGQWFSDGGWFVR